VPTNVLTIDASDPKSGTAEFKACAVRLEPALLCDAVDAEADADPLRVLVPGD
jgi:hypothetical protein